MTFMQGAIGQVECMWQYASGTANTLLDGTQGTLGGWYNSIEFYTDLAAKYIFGIDRSTKTRDLVLKEFVAPLVFVIIPTTFFGGVKAGLFVVVAATVYTLVIAKKKGYC